MQKLRAAIAWLSVPSRRFIPLFLVCLWILTTLSGKIPRSGIQTFLEVTAWIDYQLLGLFTDKVTLSGIHVTLDGFAVQIITECTGLFEAVILASAVLAYHATWRERLWGIFLGTSILYAINIVRIACLLVVGRFAPTFFDFAHIYFWQSLLIVFITAIWLAWIHFFVSDVSQKVVHDETSPPLRA